MFNVRIRPPSPAVMLLHTSTDAKSAVDLVISQIASNDIQTSLQALHQVNHCLYAVSELRSSSWLDRFCMG